MDERSGNANLAGQARIPCIDQEEVRQEEVGQAEA
jgi:hypothetical protein